MFYGVFIACLFVEYLFPATGLASEVPVPIIVMLYVPGLGSWTLALFGGEEKAMQWIFARC